MKKKNGFKKAELERNADNSGREFWAWIFGGLEIIENKAENLRNKNRHQNSLRNSPAVALKFAWPKF